MLNAPTCATQQFIGALTNKIADAMSNVISPLLSIQSILVQSVQFSTAKIKLWVGLIL